MVTYWGAATDVWGEKCELGRGKNTRCCWAQAGISCCVIAGMQSSGKKCRSMAMHSSLYLIMIHCIVSTDVNIKTCPFHGPHRMSLPHSMSFFWKNAVTVCQRSGSSDNSVLLVRLHFLVSVILSGSCSLWSSNSGCSITKWHYKYRLGSVSGLWEMHCRWTRIVIWITSSGVRFCAGDWVPVNLSNPSHIHFVRLHFFLASKIESWS